MSVNSGIHELRNNLPLLEAKDTPLDLRSRSRRG